MSAVERVFGRSRVLLAVVHARDVCGGKRSIDVAKEAGADGVFVVTEQSLGVAETEEVGLHAVEAGFWTGINYLGSAPGAAAQRVAPVWNGLWTDGASGDAALVFRERGWYGLYFGSVAFKYQVAVPPEREVEVARVAASMGIDVVTTSGPATGAAASIDKVRRFREGCGEHALALASGVRADNVAAFLPYVDAYLVGTGIEREFGVVDRHRCRRLADLIHGYSKGAHR